MADFPEQQNQDSKRLKRAFIPSPLEIAVLMIGSFLFLVAVNSLPAFRSVDGANYELVIGYIQDVAEKLLAPVNNQQGSTVLTVLFWMVIGMAVYFSLWIINGLITSYRSDVTRTKGMIVPRGYSDKKVFHETVLRLTVRVFSTGLFLYWIYLLFAGILPYASSTFLNSITDFSLKSIGMVVASTAILAGSIFVAIVFTRCIVLRDRVFGS